MFKSLFCMIVKMIVINIVLILFFASAPFLYVIVPFWFLLTHRAGAEDMFTLYMLSGPFACGFWMTVLCHWQTVRLAQAQGRLKKWRDAEGGMFCTVGTAIRFMAMGWCGSALAEVIFCVAAQSLLRRLTGWLEFFTIAPLAVFAPTWIVLLCHWMRGRHEDLIIRRGC